MITINLTPVEELENPTWWVPDLAILLGVLATSLLAVYFYVSTIESEINLMEADKQRMMSETQTLGAEVERFNSLNQKIEQLDSKKTSLKRITESKLARYLPIILLESVQNLKPEGVWLTGLAFVDKKAERPGEAAPVANVPNPNNQAAAANDPNKPKPIPTEVFGGDHPFFIEIMGLALSNVSIADFMLSLKTTQNQSYEKADLRTQLFFSDVAINFSQISTDQGQVAGKDFVSFKLQLSSRERSGKEGDPMNRFSQFIEDFRQHGQASMN